MEGLEDVRQWHLGTCSVVLDYRLDSVSEIFSNLNSSVILEAVENKVLLWQ